MLIPNAITTQTGGFWQNYAATWSATGTQPSIGDGSIFGRYTQIGKTTIAFVTITMGSTTTFGTGSYLISLPVSAASGTAGMGGLYCVLADASGGPTTYMAVPYINSVTDMAIQYHDAANNGRNIIVNNTSPFTWAQSDVLRASILYEAA